MYKTKRTVFITGAGASWHYGYPTGEALVSEVLDRAERAIEYLQRLDQSVTRGIWEVPIFVLERIEHQAIMDALRRTTGISALIQEFQKIMSRLRAVDPLVIDYFLGQNQDLATIGKFLISWSILDNESNKYNKNRKAEDRHYSDNWYRFVIQKLVADCPSPESLLENEVGFITFNYDVSLEQRLCAALSSIQFFSQGDLVKKFFETTPFIHVYGKVRHEATAVAQRLMADTRERANVGDKDYHDQARALMDAVYQASKGIRTIAPDEKAETEESRAAKELLRNADRVYILGFGFDDENCRLLDLANLLSFERSRNGGKRKEVMFTNFNDRNSINKKASRIFMGESKRFLPGRDSICIEQGSIFEKSTRNVYEALAFDFDSPDDTWT